MLEAPDHQVSLTDPDACSMATSGRGTGMVGYNVQTAVDAKHHLIVAHEVTNVGHDRTQLANMAMQAKEALDTDALSVVADRGYFKSEEILACEDAGIETYLPKPQTSGNQAKGRTLHLYWTSRCRACAIKAQCTTGVHRKMTRWEHEAVLEKAQARLDRNPAAMSIRRATVEHPFGTLKAWMGSTHFLTKSLSRVSTEMSLHVLAYNMKRMMNILGTKTLIEAIGA